MRAVDKARSIFKRGLDQHKEGNLYKTMCFKKKLHSWHQLRTLSPNLTRMMEKLWSNPQKIKIHGNKSLEFGSISKWVPWYYK